MDSVLAQLGIGASGPGSEERLRGMADTIRGDQKLGQFYQASGNQDVRNAGRGLIDKADTTISNVANARQKGLTRTRQAMMDERDANQTAYDRNRDTEMDLLAADDTAYTRGRDTMTDELDAAALEYERSGWTDVESYTDEDGTVTLRGRKDGRGPLMEVPDSAGYTPYKAPTYSSTSAKRVYIPGTDASYLEYPDGSVTFSNNKYRNMDEFKNAHPKLTQSIQSQEVTEIAGETEAKKLADLGAVDTNTAFANARQTRSVIKGMKQILGNARAVDPNQEKWMSYLPTLQSETALQETLIRQLAVQNIPADMRPFSDADKEFFVSSINPNLPRKEYIKYYENKIQGLEIAAEIQDEIADTYLKHGRGGVLTADQRDALKQRVKDITGSYEVLKPSGVAVFGPEDKPMMYNGKEVTEEDITTTMQKHNMTRQQVLDRLGGGG